MNMSWTPPIDAETKASLDADVEALDRAKHSWARTSVGERMALLVAIKDRLMRIAEGWAEIAARRKRIPAGSPLAGEEWISGPYALMAGCNGLLHTLSQMKDKEFVKHLPMRKLANGQTAVRIMPHSIWDRLLLSGVKAEVWMQPGVTETDVASFAATAYDTPADQRAGKVALVLGAGNIAAISPLDAFQKLFLENQVVILKMNPVNDYLTDYLRSAMSPLIERDVLRIVTGGGDVGAYLTDHPLVSDIHITGAGATHDAIIWGGGDEGRRNKAAGTPKNRRHITSELGAVCPTIVVPGPWTAADIRFQAEHIATQKLHNSGFNCVACQALILPADWDKTQDLLHEVGNVMGRAGQREAYYPGADKRLAEFTSRAGQIETIDRGPGAPACIVADMERGDVEWLQDNEVFAPALGKKLIASPDPETYLRNAVAWANSNLYGTLGANILIHPSTIRQIGKKRFEGILADLRYGTIAINAWTGLGFLLNAVPWGGFAGATLQDVQSGIGTAHNSFMLEKTERTIVTAPWSPFPRNLLSGRLSLLPRPPWFVTNRRQDRLGKLLTSFQYKPSILKLPRIFYNALLG